MSPYIRQASLQWSHKGGVKDSFPSSPLLNLNNWKTGTFWQDLACAAATQHGNYLLFAHKKWHLPCWRFLIFNLYLERKVFQDFRILAIVVEVGDHFFIFSICCLVKMCHFLLCAYIQHFIILSSACLFLQTKLTQELLNAQIHSTTFFFPLCHCCCFSLSLCHH